MKSLRILQCAHRLGWLAGLTVTSCATPNPSGFCSDRVGGALITFNIAGETMTAWFTNTSFIDEALALETSGAMRTAMFQLVDGRDCDAQWSWHVDPLNAKFSDLAMELCDGLPSFVEKDKDYWLHNVGSFCPWHTQVARVDDRRSTAAKPSTTDKSVNGLNNGPAGRAIETPYFDIPASDRKRAMNGKTGGDEK